MKGNKKSGFWEEPESDSDLDSNSSVNSDSFDKSAANPIKKDLKKNENKFTIEEYNLPDEIKATTKAFPKNTEMYEYIKIPLAIQIYPFGKKVRK